jgi:hypothetical protein
MRGATVVFQRPGINMGSVAVRAPADPGLANHSPRELKSDYVRANTFLLFPGLPLVEYSRQKGYVDADFDIDTQLAESQEITLKTPHAREFRNIASPFWLMVKFPPSWIPFFKKLVKLPDNILFRIIGSFNMCQELLF